MSLKDDLTVTLFTSPLPSHPGDWILENVYLSVRNQLPDCRIIILADGIDGEEPASYKDFKGRIKSRGYEVVEFSGWHNESLMFKHCLQEMITTPLILVGEGDWGMQNLPIEWEGLVAALMDPAIPYSYINIRQNDIDGWENGHFGATIRTHGITLLETNWFQTPMHLARCDWYRKIVENFTLPAQLECDQLAHALQDNNAVKDMTCYIPTVDPGHPKRLYHWDGKNAKELYIPGNMFDPEEQRRGQ